MNTLYSKKGKYKIVTYVICHFIGSIWKKPIKDTLCFSDGFSSLINPGRQEHTSGDGRLNKDFTGHIEVCPS